MHAPEPVWAVVVPVKGGTLAKTRLGLPSDTRAALADAFARDTVAALTAASSVASVLVVTADPTVAGWGPAAGARVVADPGGGLDAAVAAGVAVAGHHGYARVAVVLGDHPALRPREVDDALAAASEHDRAILADAEGAGTALLTGRPDASLPTAFGAGSAAAHVALGYEPLLVAADGLRVDVDDAGSLAAATALGVGPATRSALAAAPR